jgi:RNA polymerase sigma factor (TIGR02999 family)
MNHITRCLNALDQGDPQAASQLLPIVYDELRKLAAKKLAHEKPGQTLDPTALVHEVYLRLVQDANKKSAEASDSGWSSRRHFFAAASEAMRRILVENARRKGRLKHGGGRHREHSDVDGFHADGPAQELLALHETLEKFAAHDPIKAKLAELRFFAGLTLEQAAQCLNISLSSADRAWRYARAWLYSATADDNSEKK